MLPLMEWKEEKNTPNSWKQQERNNNFQGPMFLEAFRFFFSYSHFMDTCILRNKKKKRVSMFCESLKGSKIISCVLEPYSHCL